MSSRASELIARARQHFGAGDLRRAAQDCESAIAMAIAPQLAEARALLGLIAVRQGELHDAVRYLQQACEGDPGSPAYRSNLGIALADLGDRLAARDCFETAIRMNPAYAPAHFALGNLHYAQGDLAAALASYRVAAELAGDARSHFRLAVTLDALGRHREAIDHYRRIEEVNPDYPGLRNNLGRSLMRAGMTDDAIRQFEAAIRIAPGDPVPWNNLGNALTDLGLPAEGIDHYRRALEIAPDYHKAHSNLLLNLNYVEDDQSVIYARSLRFMEAVQAPSAPAARSFGNSADPDRRLRVGYLSPDFRRHSVSYFLLPVLEAHRHEEFEIFGYADVRQPDEFTHRCREASDHWRSIAGQDDQSVMQQIASDQIDILVDLAGHTAGNRMPLFARKPAPVQVSWLGYPNTTGISAIDYRFTDAVADPPGAADDLHVERLVRLPAGFLCYQPDRQSPAVAPPPCAAAGVVTFGSFNSLAKVTDATVSAWAGLLAAVAGSRLLLKAQQLGSPRGRALWQRKFEAAGIAPEQLSLLPPEPGKRRHFEIYAQVDIGLDPFPYNGATTTCEALWMGVPVLTLLGSRHAGRVGASILNRVGLQDLVAADPGAYVQLGARLARDRDRLESLRYELRPAMQASSLMNAARFAAGMETAYRELWRRWCASLP